LVYLEPGSSGNKYSTFKYNPKNYDNFKRWMLESLEDEAPLPGISIPGFKDEVQL
jgi:hypothetical protein